MSPKLEVKPSPYLSSGGSQRTKEGKPGWRLRWTANGKQQSAVFYGSYESAVLELREKEKASESGLDAVANRKVRLGDWVTEWSAVYRESGKRRSTWKEHELNARRLTTVLEGLKWDKRRIASFTATDCQTLVREFLLEDSSLPSASSRKSFSKTLRMALLAAKRSGVISASPMEDVSASWGPEELNPDEVLLHSEVEAIAEQLGKQAKYLSDMWLVLCYSGLRISEALGLKCSRVDFGSKQISVRERVTVSGGRRDDSAGLKTASSMRDVSILSQCRVPLASLIERSTELGSDFVFTGQGRRARYKDASGRMVRVDELRAIGYGTFVRHLRTAVEACKKAKTVRRNVDVTAHSARHFYCTLMLSASIPLDVVSRQMGHSSERITRQVYGRWLLPGAGLDYSAQIEEFLTRPKREVSAMDVLMYDSE